MGHTVASSPRTALEGALASKRLSIREVADQAGVARSTLHRAVAGEVVLRADDLARVAGVLDTPLADLVDAGA